MSLSIRSPPPTGSIRLHTPQTLEPMVPRPNLEKEKNERVRKGI